MLNRERQFLESVLPGLDRILIEQPLAYWEADATKVAGLFRSSGAPGIFVPTQYGGKELPAKQAIYLQVAVASRCPSLAIMMTMHNFTILTLKDLPPYLPYADGLLQTVAHDNCLVSSGFAEGRSGADILDSNMLVTEAPRGFLINGDKKPCSMTHHFDYMTANVSYLNEQGFKQPGLVIVPANAPGITRKPFWRSPVLQAADSNEVQLRDVFIDDTKIFLPAADDADLQGALMMIQAIGMCWFQLLVASSYLGVAGGLMEKAVAKPNADSHAVAELVIEFEGAITALEGLAEVLSVGNFDGGTLAKSLAVRFSVQQHINTIVQQSVDLLGGMNYLQNPDIQYLLSVSRCLAFHPLSRAAATEVLAGYIIER